MFGELAVLLFGSGLIGSSSFFNGIKQTEMNSFLPDLNEYPIAISFIELNSFYSSRIVRTYLTCCGILCWTGFSQVNNAVVISNSVDMVKPFNWVFSIVEFPS